jgi:hypothetical protein
MSNNRELAQPFSFRSLSSISSHFQPPTFILPLLPRSRLGGITFSFCYSFQFVSLSEPYHLGALRRSLETVPETTTLTLFDKTALHVIEIVNIH